MLRLRTSDALLSLRARSSGDSDMDARRASDGSRLLRGSAARRVVVVVVGGVRGLAAVP